MPILQWIGKEKVVNHHLEVPCHVLSRTYSFDEEGQKEKDNGSENMVIHGDNLLALKSLLPQYEGRVKCIYIDPPYNTGNEGWVYNDAVNDPVIKRWLGEVVGKEGEDLSRHDKWLCMMYPRLRLLQRLLSDDGAIFISIDDNEFANLKLICDEIFGAGDFVGHISWQRTYSPRSDSKGISNEVESVLVYKKSSSWMPKKLPRTEKMNAMYGRKDGDKVMWRSDNPCAPGAATHQGMVYAIQNPFTGRYLYPTNGACWRYHQDDMLEIMREWADYELVDLHDENERAKVCGVDETAIKKGVKGIVIKGELSEAKRKAKKRMEQGSWPIYYFSQNGKGGITKKTYLKAENGRVVTNFWACSEVGHTDEAKKELKALFAGKSPFDTPKPTRLIQRILQIATDKDSIVLDSFAGSGTTAHAVLKQNAEDGGNRKFILIEMGDYADSITAERVKRVIHGYGEGKKAVSGTGGDFSFYELGAPLMKDGFLNEDASEKAIRDYVYFMDTRENRAQEKADEPYFLGTHQGAAYYFYYKKGEATVLSYDFLATVKTEAESYVMYADSCLLSDEELSKYHITFKKIPRDIARL